MLKYHKNLTMAGFYYRDWIVYRYCAVIIAKGGIFPSPHIMLTKNKIGLFHLFKATNIMQQTLRDVKCFTIRLCWLYIALDIFYLWYSDKLSYPTETCKSWRARDETALDRESHMTLKMKQDWCCVHSSPSRPFQPLAEEIYARTSNFYEWIAIKCLFEYKEQKCKSV